ncbi:unnamed protein product, partial [marine sediment metagenome]
LVTLVTLNPGMRALKKEIKRTLKKPLKLRNPYIIYITDTNFPL